MMRLSITIDQNWYTKYIAINNIITIVMYLRILNAEVVTNLKDESLVCHTNSLQG